MIGRLLQLAHLGADVDAAAVGQHEVEHHRVGRAHRRRRRAPPASVSAASTVVAGVAQDHLQAADDLRLVVDDEDALRLGAHVDARRLRRRAGSETANDVPSAGAALQLDARRRWPPRSRGRSPARGPSPAAPRRAAEERLEDCARAATRGMPRPRSITRTVDLAAAGAAADPHRRAVGRELDRVLDQVGEHALELGGVGLHQRQVARAARARSDARRAARAPGPRRSTTTSLQVAPVGARVDRAGLDPREVEQVVDQPREPRGLGLDHRDQGLAVARPAGRSLPQRRRPRW